MNLISSTVYSVVGNFEGENFCENNEHEGFTEKIFADSYYRPGMGCGACDVCEENFHEWAQIHEIGESFLPPTIRYISFKIKLSIKRTFIISCILLNMDTLVLFVTS